MPIVLWLVSKGVPAKWAKPLLYGAGALLIIIAIIIAVKIHDSNIRKNALDNQDQVISNAVINADRIAAEQKQAQDNAFANSQGNVTSAINNAVAKSPDQAAKPVGPASQSYFDELRRQQGKSK